MTLKTCMMTNSTCYREGSPAVPRGIVVHSTGAANPALKRYVQPSEDDPMHDEILADIGKNQYGNDWNHATRYAGVHAFIGKNAAGEIETYQVLPYDRCAWGVGKGTKGSYNFDPTAHLQFEICEDDLTDEGYFTAVMREAAEYCAHLSKTFGFDPMTDICSHYESYKAGYGGNHSDPHEWLKKFGRDMDWFRAEVARLMEMPGSEPLFRVRKTFADAASSAGVFLRLDDAVNACPPGFAVFDAGGETVYRRLPVKPGDRVRVREGVKTFRSGTAIPALLRRMTLTVRSVRLDGGPVCALSLLARGPILGELAVTDTESVRKTATGIVR